MGFPEKKNIQSKDLQTIYLDNVGFNEARDLCLKANAKKDIVFDKMLEALKESKVCFSQNAPMHSIIKQAIKAGEEFKV